MKTWTRCSFYGDGPATEASKGVSVKIVAIIQARMGSTRLPGKVLKDLGGETVLARVVRRTQRAALLDSVVVATSTADADIAIVNECHRLSIRCFRGDEQDVLDRYYQCARQLQADAVVRITSDCPLIDPGLITAVTRRLLDDRPDYATNTHVRTYPRGLDVEVFSGDALTRAWLKAQLPYERIHVTPYFYEVSGRFRVASLTSEPDYSHHRWTLDTTEDFELIRTIYERFAGLDDMSWREVLALLEREPELAQLNSQVRQKMLHEG
jgi:spore coat polysaccharide biosynthesis protein SpsF